jgi:hypothetical protein
MERPTSIRRKKPGMPYTMVLMLMIMYTSLNLTVHFYEFEIKFGVA